MMTSEGIISHPHPVTAGLDPAIQASLQAAVWLMNWMAASMAGLNPAIRAAMTKKGMHGPNVKLLALVE